MPFPKPARIRVFSQPAKLAMIVAGAGPFFTNEISNRAAALSLSLRSLQAQGLELDLASSTHGDHNPRPVAKDATRAGHPRELKGGKAGPAPTCSRGPRLSPKERARTWGTVQRGDLRLVLLFLALQSPQPGAHNIRHSMRQTPPSCGCHRPHAPLQSFSNVFYHCFAARSSTTPSRAPVPVLRSLRAGGGAHRRHLVALLDCPLGGAATGWQRRGAGDFVQGAGGARWARGADD